MNNYARMKAFTEAVLVQHGFTDATIHPGPALPDVPGRFIVWTRYGGTGLELEGVLDGKGWQSRVVGFQNDYTSAEEIADVIDTALLSHHSSYVEGVWVPEIRRVGGAPAALMEDDADRTHFVCSYIISHAMALAN